VKRELYIVFSSNRGLCGAFNAQLTKKIRQVLKEDAGREAVFIAVGKKIEQSLRRMNGTILATFPDLATEATTEGLRPIATMAMEEFTSGRVDRVIILESLDNFLERLMLRRIQQVDDVSLTKRTTPLN
jgi:F-type H+-transporting ATPase subunit gamma